MGVVSSNIKTFSLLMRKSRRPVSLLSIFLLFMLEQDVGHSPSNGAMTLQGILVAQDPA